MALVCGQRERNSIVTKSISTSGLPSRQYSGREVEPDPNIHSLVLRLSNKAELQLHGVLQGYSVFRKKNQIYVLPYSPTIPLTTFLGIYFFINLFLYLQSRKRGTTQTTVQ